MTRGKGAHYRMTKKKREKKSEENTIIQSDKYVVYYQLWINSRKRWTALKVTFSEDVIRRPEETFSKV